MLKGHDSKHNSRVILFGITVLVVVSLVVTCCFYLYKLAADSNRKSAGYDALRSSAAGNSYGSDLKELSEQVNSSSWTDPMDRAIDFDYLQSLNPDICSWMYLPQPYIDMPVLQEQTVGEYFYLTHDYERRYEFNGSLFIPASPGGLDDAHTLVFGHNIGTYSDAMFSQLPRTFMSKDFAKDNQYLYMYYPDRTERWKVYTASNIMSDNLIYDIPYTIGSDDYAQLLRYVALDAIYKLCDEPTSKDRLLVLSTCNGDEGTQKRFAVTYLCDTVKALNQNSTDTKSAQND